MYKLLVNEVTKPLMRRLGTMVSAYLVGLGVANDVTNTIVLGLTAACGVALDLLLSHWERK